MRQLLLIYLFCLTLLLCPLQGTDLSDVIERADSLITARAFDSSQALLEHTIEQLSVGERDQDSIRASCYYYLGKCQFNRGDYNASGQYHRQAYELRDSLFGQNNVQVGLSLNAIGVVLWMQGKYSEVEEYYDRASSIFESILGREHEYYLDCCNNRMYLYITTGRLEDAEKFGLQALQLAERVCDSTNDILVKIINNLGTTYYRLGRYSEAEPRYIRAIELTRAKYGGRHLNVGMYENNLGMLYYTQGKYSLAEKIQLESIQIREENLGKEHFQVAKGLNNLALIYLDLRRFDDAEPLFLRSIDIKEKTLGKNHINIASSLTNLANLYAYSDEKRFDTAIVLYDRALSIIKNGVGESHSFYPEMLSNLAELYFMKEDYAKAESLHVHCLELRENISGASHPSTAFNLNAIGQIRMKEGNYSAAESLFVKSLGLMENAYGMDNGANCKTLELIAKSRMCQKDFDGAFSCAMRAHRLRHNDLMDGIDILTEKDALKYSQYLRTNFGLIMSCYFDWNTLNDTLTDKVAQTVFGMKGLITEISYQRQARALQTTDSTALRLRNTLLQKKHNLAELFVTGPGGDVDQFKADADSLRQSIKKVELSLANIGVNVTVNTRLTPPNTSDILAGLPKGAILIEYMQYDVIIPEADSIASRYLAVVAAKGRKPKIVNIGDADKINEVLGEYRRHMYRIANYQAEAFPDDQFEFDQLNEDFYSRIWKPVEPFIGGASILIIAPDGMLNTLAFETIKGNDDAYLIEHYPIHYVSSGRDIPRFNLQSETGGEGLIAFADPDFDRDDSSNCGQLTNESFINVDSSRSKRGGFRFNCMGIEDIHLDRLPGTRQEVLSLSASLNGNGHLGVTTYFDGCASEGRLKSEAPGHRFVHIATHGYYFENTCLLETENNIGYSGENPLLLSGLFLAGANSIGSENMDTGSDDGVLTAMEVSGMDLRGVELVVLSGCETGLGEIETGEGVYGLRRAFQLAGARIVISSLWPVNDMTTADILGRLYDDDNDFVFNKLQKVILSRISQLKNQGKVTHPYNWAGFIATGQWK
ncbi:MAG: tetratricopeptide repeat protein [Candidatus Zixiibacteriota bacterium]